MASARIAAKSERTRASRSGEVCKSMLRESSVMAPACFGAIVTLRKDMSEAVSAEFSATQPAVVLPLCPGISTFPERPLSTVAPREPMTSLARRRSMNISPR